MSRKIIDPATFTAVQPHFVAAPIFEGLDDPLPQRSGFLEGESDTVKVPDIPKPPEKPQSSENDIQIAKPMTLVQFNQIVEWAAENEPGEGQRNFYWGAIAGFLKRQGISDEDVGEIVYEAACAANDEEAKSRQASALNACHRINSGMTMTGLQTLIKEFYIDDADRIIALIGTKKVDPEEMIEKLTENSDAKEIEGILKHLVGLSSTETEKMLKKINKKTKVTLKALSKDLVRVRSNSPDADSIFDHGESVARQTLSERFESGENLIRVNKRYMGYNGKFWEEIPDDYISGLALPYAEDALKIHKGINSNLSDLVGQASRIIKWRSTRKGDALRTLEEPYPVINTPNAEIWLHKDCSVDVLPHSSDSYQFGCINVAYDPKAKCPVFDRTLLEIFDENDEPEEMVRHFYEFLAYAMQPMRDIAAFGMMVGASNCGKSKIAETLSRLLGHEAVLHMKLEAFTNDKDAIGNLLGKRVVIDDDLTQGVIFPDGVAKMLSETKRVMGELKYANKFPFLSYALILMIGNQYPRIFKADYSIKRRALIFPFKRTFKESEDNRDLFPGIWRDQQEMSGILNRCIEAYQRLRERGHFEQPNECKYAYDEWVSGCTFISRFINEICQPNDGPNQTWQEHVQVLYEWANAEDIKVNMNPKELRKVYELSGIKFGTTGGVLTVKGIKAPDLLDLPL